ncbi:TPA: MobH family relaxase [Pseudomonas aeruginosa]
MRSRMLAWIPFIRTAPPDNAQKNADGFVPYKSADELLATPRRQLLLENIWHRTSVNREQFNKLYLSPIKRYAEIVQQLPASENHHHAYLGGMIDHGLEIIAYALKLRQSFVLPVGSTPEVQSAQSEAWSAAVVFAALLHDIGKVAVDVKVQLRSGNIWRAWDGPMKEDYRFQYVKGRQYKLHGAAAGLLYTQVIPSEVMNWLSQYPELWGALLYVLAGQFEHSGVLGDIVVRSDQASVAHELGGNPDRAVAAPRNTLQRQLLDGLRYLMKNELKLNQPEASDGWITADAIWLVSKTVSDRLRAHLLSQGIEGVPDRNSTLFNVFQDNGLIVANPAGKAIWDAEILSPTGWKNTFTFLRVSPSLIWSAGEDRPEPFGGSVQVLNEEPAESESPNLAPLAHAAEDLAEKPSCNVQQGDVVAVEPPVTKPAAADDHGAHATEMDDTDYLLDLMDMREAPMTSVPAPAMPGRSEVQPAEPEDQPVTAPATTIAGPAGGTLGHQFMHWLKVGVGTHKIIINDAKAKVHTVNGTAFLVTPEIFRRYAQEHPTLFSAKAGEGQPWLQVQKSFEKLKLHVKKNNGHNIWTCEVFGPRKTKTLKGYMLKKPGDVFTTEMLDNPNLKLCESQDEH